MYTEIPQSSISKLPAPCWKEATSCTSKMGPQ